MSEVVVKGRYKTLLATFAYMNSLVGAAAVLLEGEIWSEKDPGTGQFTGRRKTGDGVASFSALPFDPVPSTPGGDSFIGDPSFIQDTSPTVGQLNGATRYQWWDTSGGNLTLWIEDGT